MFSTHLVNNLLVIQTSTHFTYLVIIFEYTFPVDNLSVIQIYTRLTLKHI